MPVQITDPTVKMSGIAIAGLELSPAGSCWLVCGSDGQLYASENGGAYTPIGASGELDIVIPDNDVNAFRVRQGADEYIGVSTLNGAEAAEIGMVNRAVAPERVLPEALELAREIAANGPFAVAGVKQALARSPLASLDDQLGFEAAEQARCFETRDLQEGLAAGKQRRAPRFEGR
jgi:hypothetical protein